MMGAMAFAWKTSAACGYRSAALPGNYTDPSETI
jgi:hypothetical protein